MGDVYRTTPETSQPEDVVKYLARYLTGGPISDRRLVSHDGRQVVFTARKGTTHGGSDETEEVSVPLMSLYVAGVCTFCRPASRRAVGLVAGAVSIANLHGPVSQAQRTAEQC